MKNYGITLTRGNTWLRVDKIYFELKIFSCVSSANDSVWRINWKCSLWMEPHGLLVFSRHTSDLDGKKWLRTAGQVWDRHFDITVGVRIAVGNWCWIEFFYLWVVYNCFFEETGPAMMHRCDVISHAVWKIRTRVTAGSFPEWGGVYKTATIPLRYRNL